MSMTTEELAQLLEATARAQMAENATLELHSQFNTLNEVAKANGERARLGDQLLEEARAEIIQLRERVKHLEWQRDDLHERNNKLVEQRRAVHDLNVELVAKYGPPMVDCTNCGFQHTGPCIVSKPGNTNA